MRTHFESVVLRLDVIHSFIAAREGSCSVCGLPGHLGGLMRVPGATRPILLHRVRRVSPLRTRQVPLVRVPTRPRSVCFLLREVPKDE